jgi:luciferase family oxidoreductase group 1
MALRGAAGRDDSDIENFPQYLDDVVALMGTQGVRVPLRLDREGRPPYVLKATPAATSEPRMWLLGSSMYSAHLAAAKGLPYVFAHHFSGQGTAEALSVYRSQFVPSDLTREPVTFLTVNAVVADSEEEAQALLLPNLQTMARLRSGYPLTAVDLVENAQELDAPPQWAPLVESGRARTVVGTPEVAAETVRELADRYGVDEVMVNPVASAFRGTDPRTAPGRERTLELLAKVLL